MKLHFESDLPYQAAAVEAVCDLFRGQEVCRSVFSVTAPALTDELQQSFEGKQFSDSGGVGNALKLLPDVELTENLQKVQLRNGLPPSDPLKPKQALDFTVEMETGTGKTYVYLRTVFELNQRYGFTKFAVVVPSVAIKEGVNKTLQITREHFESLYPGAKGYEFFQYDSDRLGEVRNFATSPNIQIMVITVGAINKFGDEAAAEAEESDEAKRREKSKNKMYRASEKTGGERPIDLIRSTQPILIVDEPQSVDGGNEGKGRRALAQMDPLCTLRYSATHVDKHNMVYRLDAIDAYEQKLVKQIEVAAATVQGGNNKPYVKLLAVTNKKGVISASIEVDRQNASGAVRREPITVQSGFDLEQETGRPLYANVRIGEIRAAKIDQFVELKVPGSEVYLRAGDAWGDVDAGAVQQAMIARTIKEHLDKEKRLRPLGVKVLSLFFIDEVAKYRQYDELGNSVILHDAGHRNLWRDRRRNDLVARLFIAPLLFASLTRYRETHFKHHMELGTDGGDPDLLFFARSRPTTWFWNYLDQVFSLNAWLSSMGGHLLSRQVRTASQLYIVGWWLGAVALMWVVAGPDFTVTFLVLWLLARATAFHLITTFREMCDHFGLQPGGVFTFTRDMACHGVWRWFIHPRNNGYHLTHHLLPAVPYYRLPEAHRLLKGQDVFRDRGKVCCAYFTGADPVTGAWQTRGRVS